MPPDEQHGGQAAAWLRASSADLWRREALEARAAARRAWGAVVLIAVLTATALIVADRDGQRLRRQIATHPECAAILAPPAAGAVTR